MLLGNITIFGVVSFVGVGREAEVLFKEDMAAKREKYYCPEKVLAVKQNSPDTIKSLLMR